jgi:hypothetical protein
MSSELKMDITEMSLGHLPTSPGELGDQAGGRNLVGDNHCGSVRRGRHQLPRGLAPRAHEAHSNVLSLAMVEGAIRSAQTRRRIVLGDLLDDAYRQALAAEQRPELAAALASWTSVDEVIGNASRAVPAGELKGELR